MPIKTIQIQKLLKYVFMLALVLFNFIHAQAQQKHRILVSTDIGGTDPDDNQSMIHLLMYANQFNIEGLISTSFVTGRKQHIVEMIDLYKQDLPLLLQHENGFPSPASLKNICKQGAIVGAPYKGYSTATEGSNWIIKCAKKKSSQPLWVLVWGGLEDVAQALHDAPEIKKNIRVYWIGGPNKKWGVNAYAYIAQHHPDLWMIESNATYRGWIIDTDAPDSLKAKNYYNNFIKTHGAMGADFIKYYGGNIKMGDTPSFAYLLDGNPNNPQGQSWGGSYTPIQRSARWVFKRNTTQADTVATYSIVEWHFQGPVKKIHSDSTCFYIEVSGQKWLGYYLGKGVYAVRYSPKQPETASYTIISSIKELNGQTGQYVSVNPWPGKASANDYLLGKNWFSDKTDASLFLGVQQGAKTISIHRKAFLMDWAKRWSWIK
jgi:hypothetical protein